MSEPKDFGAHYRNEFKNVKLDPYRISLLCGITHPVAQHMLKKLMRSSRKGHTEDDLVNELQCCLDRWKELIKEDKEEAKKQQVQF